MRPGGPRPGRRPRIIRNAVAGPCEDTGREVEIMEREQYAFFQGEFVPLSEAKISIMTHAFNYGTGCFEGIRGNWNAEVEELYVFRLREHYERLIRSGNILRMPLPSPPQHLSDITRELIERNGYRQNMYVRPIAYKGSLDL